MAWFMFALAAAKAAGTLAKGKYAHDAARSMARQLEAAANREDAVGQREFIDEQRKARYIESALLARAGASGAGVSDITVENLRDDILDQGLYNAMTALYNGQTRARELRMEGAMKRVKGRQARSASYLKTVGDLGTSAFSQGFGMKGADASPIQELDMADIYKWKRKGS